MAKSKGSDMDPYTSELTTEQRHSMIDRIAKEVVQRNLEGAAVMFLESIKPISYVGSQFALVVAGPFLALFGDLGIDYIRFFESRDNVEQLIQRIEERVRARDDAEEKAKEDRNSISRQFHVQLMALPGFKLVKQLTDGGENSGTIAISQEEREHNGSLVISFEKCDSLPTDLMLLASDRLQRVKIRQALMLSDDIFVKNLETRKNVKIRGHKAVFNIVEWSNSEGWKEILQYFVFWCNRSRRAFFIGLKTRSLVSDKLDKSRMEPLRAMVTSLRCHRDLFRSIAGG